MSRPPSRWKPHIGQGFSAVTQHLLVNLSAFLLLGLWVRSYHSGCSLVWLLPQERRPAGCLCLLELQTSMDNFRFLLQRFGSWNCIQNINTTKTLKTVFNIDKIWPFCFDIFFHCIVLNSKKRQCPLV